MKPKNKGKRQSPQLGGLALFESLGLTLPLPFLYWSEEWSSSQEHEYIGMSYSSLFPGA